MGQPAHVPHFRNTRARQVDPASNRIERLEEADPVIRERGIRKKVEGGPRLPLIKAVWNVELIDHLRNPPKGSIPLRVLRKLVNH
jgi:hypothetical protein